VCMETFEKTSIRGLLSCSHHQFCFHCILGWAEVTNKCPLCLTPFHTITAAKARGPWLTRGDTIEVEDKDPDYSDSEEPECAYCHNAVCEEQFISCESCWTPYHFQCLGMRERPDVDEWYCDDCLEQMPKSVQKRQWKKMQAAGRNRDLQLRRSLRIRRRQTRHIDRNL